MTVAQLENCIAFQTVNIQIVGNYAVNKGFISDGVFRQILIQNQQANKNKSIEHLKFDRFLSKSQMFELLMYQALNHNYLGVSLVNLGYMSSGSLESHLNRFRKIILDTDNDHEHEVSGQHVMKLLQKEAVTQYRNYLFNRGYATELDTVSIDCIRDDNKLNFTSPLKLNTNESYYAGISLDIDTLVNVTAFLYDKYRICSGMDELYETFGQILFNLNYAVCRKLEKSGLKLEYGAVQYLLPPCRDCLTNPFTKILDDYIDFFNHVLSPFFRYWQYPLINCL